MKKDLIKDVGKSTNKFNIEDWAPQEAIDDQVSARKTKNNRSMFVLSSPDNENEDDDTIPLTDKKVNNEELKVQQNK